jgi:NADH-quinone oxidoreductase subunit E
MESKHQDIASEIERIRSEHGPGASLMPALHLMQEKFGWLDGPAISLVARTLGVPEATARGVATFYSMFHFAPVGRHVIQLCSNVTCMVTGAESLLDLLNKKYSLEPGGTTRDGRFSLVIMECIGACGSSPAALIDNDLHENLSAERLAEILERYR